MQLFQSFFRTSFPLSKRFLSSTTSTTTNHPTKPLHKSLYNRVKLLLVQGDFHIAQQLVTNLGFSNHPAAQALLQTDRGELNNMRRGYLRNKLQNGDWQGAQKLFNDIKNNGHLNRKIKNMFQHERQAYVQQQQRKVHRRLVPTINQQEKQNHDEEQANTLSKNENKESKENKASKASKASKKSKTTSMGPLSRRGENNISYLERHAPPPTTTPDDIIDSIKMQCLVSKNNDEENMADMLRKEENRIRREGRLKDKQSIYNQVKLLLVRGEMDRAQRFVNGMKASSYDSVLNDLLETTPTQLNYMRRAYISTCWKNNDSDGAHDLFNAINTNGQGNRKIAKIFQHEQAAFEQRTRTADRQERQEEQPKKQTLHQALKEVEAFEDLADKYLKKERYVDTLKRKKTEQVYPTTNSVPRVPNSLSALFTKPYQSTFTGTVPQNKAPEVVADSLKKEDMALLNISELIVMGDVSTAASLFLEHRSVLSPSSQTYLETLLLLDSKTMAHIRCSYLHQLSTLSSSHLQQNVEKRAQQEHNYGGGFQHEGAYEEAAYMLTNLLLHGNCTNKELHVFLQCFASGSNEMQKWMKRFEDSSGSRAKAPPNINCYNTLLETLRIEGDEESATNVLDVEMDNNKIAPNKKTWRLLQNTSEMNLSKMRSMRLIQLYNRNDNLSMESAEDLLFGNLIPNGVATTYHHNLVLRHMHDSETMKTHIDNYMWSSNESKSKDLQRNVYNSKGLNTGLGSVPDVAT
jgi:hypothetical protein